MFVTAQEAARGGGGACLASVLRLAGLGRRDERLQIEEEMQKDSRVGVVTEHVNFEQHECWQWIGPCARRAGHHPGHARAWLTWSGAARASGPAIRLAASDILQV